MLRVVWIHSEGALPRSSILTQNSPRRGRGSSFVHRPGLGDAEAARRCGFARGAGAACRHVVVDDFSRVAYAASLPGERKGAARRSLAGACVS